MTADLVAEARARATAVGAFNVILLEHAEAIVAGAEEAGLPVILQISENCVRYHGALAPIGRAALSIARAAAVPVGVHLDHAEDEQLVREAVELGFDSVMFDASHDPYDRNLARTREIAAWCRARGVRIEAELGEVGGKDGVHAPGARTDPDDARRFVASTGVDWLAVAVGTSHAMTDRVATVDLGLVERIAASAGVPLVLHGSSGVADDELRRAVGAGIAKVNLATHLNAVFTRELRRELGEHPDLVDPRRYVARGRAALGAESSRLLELLGR